jgi:RNA polymerase sigma factor (sigma-70 family)
MVESAASIHEMKTPLKSHLHPRLKSQPNATMTPDTSDLDTEFSDGPHDALQRAYERHGSLIYTFCRRSVGPDQAKDVTQEVFITAWRMRHRFDPQRGSLAGWLIGIAKNKVREALRRRQLHLINDDHAPSVGLISPDDVDQLADRMMLAEALDQLPQRAQLLITMAFQEELTHLEIAERTSLPLGTVKSDIRRGLARLRRYVEPTDD